MATTHFTSAAAVLLAALAATTTTTHAAAVSRRNIVGSCPFAPISAGQQCYLKTLTGEVTNHEGCCDRGLTCQEAAGFKIDYKKTCQRPTPNGPPQQGSTCTTRDKPYIQTTQHCGREIVVTKCHCDTPGDATAVDGIWQCAVAGLPVCKYNACADKKAGDSCTLCAPWDRDCKETMVLKTCSDGGVCKPGGGGGGPVTIMPPVDEQCALIKCKEGYTCIPGRGCVAHTGCEKKQRGDTCTQCHPNDTDCFENKMLKTCQDDMSTLGHELTCMAKQREGPPQQGSTCTTRDKPYIQTTQHCGREIVVTKCHCDTPGDATATAVDGIWQCAVAGLPVCKYNACADKKAGDSCTLCAPWDRDCMDTMVLKTCSDGGVCKPGGGGGGPVTIMPPVDEQCALIKCKDGYTCIPGKGCVKVKPTEASADKCPLVACQEGYKCNSKNGRCFKPKPKPCMDRNTAFCAKKLPDTFSDRRIANVCKRKNVARKCQLSCGICTKL